MQKLFLILALAVCGALSTATGTSGAVTPAGTTVAPTPAGTTVAPTPAGTTVAPTPAGTTVAPTPAGTTVAPTPAGTTVAPTPAGTTVAPTPAGTTVAPTPAGTTVAPTPAATTVAPTPTPAGTTLAWLAPSATSVTLWSFNSTALCTSLTGGVQQIFTPSGACQSLTMFGVTLYHKTQLTNNWLYGWIFGPADTTCSSASIGYAYLQNGVCGWFNLTIPVQGTVTAYAKAVWSSGTLITTGPRATTTGAPATTGVATTGDASSSVVSLLLVGVAGVVAMLF